MADTVLCLQLGAYALILICWWAFQSTSSTAWSTHFTFTFNVNLLAYFILFVFLLLPGALL